MARLQRDCSATRAKLRIPGAWTRGSSALTLFKLRGMRPTVGLTFVWLAATETDTWVGYAASGLCFQNPFARSGGTAFQMVFFCFGPQESLLRQLLSKCVSFYSVLGGLSAQLLYPDELVLLNAFGSRQSVISLLPNPTESEPNTTQSKNWSSPYVGMSKSECKLAGIKLELYRIQVLYDEYITKKGPEIIGAACHQTGV